MSPQLEFPERMKRFTTPSPTVLGSFRSGKVIRSYSSTSGSGSGVGLGFTPVPVVAFSLHPATHSPARAIPRRNSFRILLIMGSVYRLGASL